MYYPYFRGKQYELITVRENAQLLADSGFVPIIEPVKESTRGLALAVGNVTGVGGDCILIVNPDCGDHCTDSAKIESLMFNDFPLASQVSAGILLTTSTSLSKVDALLQQYESRNIALVHKGFEGGSELAALLDDAPQVTRHIFVEEFCGKLYRRRFRSDGRTKVLLRDGFQKRVRNRDHPKGEPFSDLHATFADEENMDGFGDFLIVGDDYTESGGPAYAIVIHLTYIDETRDGLMYIHHFMSDRKETPADPAGKFAEALAKLVEAVNQPGSPILRSSAVQEFLDLHDADHFPGLGYVKKLSMQHHIETLADYGAKNGW